MLFTISSFGVIYVDVIEVMTGMGVESEYTRDSRKAKMNVIELYSNWYA